MIRRPQENPEASVAWRGLRSAGAVVVLVPVDFPALFVLLILDASLFSSSNVTIGTCTCLGPIDARLTPFKV